MSDTIDWENLVAHEGVGESDWAAVFGERSDVGVFEGWRYGSIAQDRPKRSDVAQVLGAWGTADDDDDTSPLAVRPGLVYMVGLFRLTDGRVLVLSGWNDYTGWGCEDGVQAYIGPDEETAVRMGLTTFERFNLGRALPDDPPAPKRREWPDKAGLMDTP
jgi:hypothetical protein